VKTACETICFETLVLVTAVDEHDLWAKKWRKRKKAYLPPQPKRFETVDLEAEEAIMLE